MGARQRRDATAGGGHGATLLVALALAAVAAWLWATWPDDPPSLSPEVVAGAPDRPAAPAPAPPPPAPPRPVIPAPPGLAAAGSHAGTGAPDEDRSARATLTGRVTRAADGTPVAGVEVSPELSRDALLADEGVAVTDADGRYRFLLDRDARALALTVGPGPDTASRSRRVSLDLRLGTETVHDVMVSAGARLAGTVEDGSGRPVPGATVSAWSRRAHEVDAGPVPPPPDRTVAADGSGRFVVVHAGPGYVLAADAPGRVPLHRLHGEAAEGAELDGLHLTLVAPRAVAGRVIDADGAPVADARVVARVARQDTAITAVAGVWSLSPPPREARSDDAGGFTVTDVPSAPVEVAVTAPGHVEWTGRHAPGDGDLDVRLSRGALLAGTVTDGAGRPVAGARLRLAGAPRGAGAHPAGGFASTDGAGRFAFDGQPALGDGHLAVVADGFAVAVVQPVTARPGQATDLRLVLQPGLVLAGRVVTVDGTPVPGAYLRLQGDRLIAPADAAIMPPPTWEAEFPDLVTARSGPDGSFRFENLYDGSFRVVASAAAYPDLVVEAQARAGARDVTLVLDPDARWGVTLSGRAYDARDGRSVPSFFVAPMSPRDGGLVSSDRSRAFETDDGEWLITGLPPGPLVLMVQARGFAPWSAPPTDYAEGSHRVDVPLLPERTLRLRVVDDARRPVPSAQLVFRDAAGEALHVAHGPSSRTSMLTTDAQGGAVAHGLPADRVVVEVRSGWLSPRREYPFDLRVEPSREQEIVYALADEPTVLVAVLAGGPQARALVEAALAEATGSPVAERFDRASAAVLVLATHVEQGRLAPLPDPTRVELRRPDGGLLAAFILQRGAPHVVPPMVRPPEAPWLARVVGAGPDALLTVTSGGSDAAPPALRLEDADASVSLRVVLVGP